MLNRRAFLATLSVLLVAGEACSPTSPTPNLQPACGAPVPSTVNVAASPSGGATTITVTTGAGCPWTVTSNDAHLTLMSGGAQTGTGSITFNVAPNTGAVPRNGTLTVTAPGQPPVVITVTQQPSTPPLTFAPGAVPSPAVVGTPYRFDFAPAAAGGVPPISFQLETAGGFPPAGLGLAPNGILSGTPTIESPPRGFRVCAVDATGTQACVLVTMSVVAAPPPAGDAALLGAWRGTIVLQVGCLPASQLPRTYTWTGTIRRNAAAGLEIVITVPGVLVFDEAYPATLNGNTFSFSGDFDSRYTFTAEVAADRRSLNGTFRGGNCAVPPTQVLPLGTWTGTHQ